MMRSWAASTGTRSESDSRQQHAADCLNAKLLDECPLPSELVALVEFGVFQIDVLLEGAF